MTPPPSLPSRVASCEIRPLFTYSNLFVIGKYTANFQEEEVSTGRSFLGGGSGRELPRRYFTRGISQNSLTNFGLFILLPLWWLNFIRGNVLGGFSEGLAFYWGVCYGGRRGIPLQKFSMGEFLPGENPHGKTFLMEKLSIRGGEDLSGKGTT